MINAFIKKNGVSPCPGPFTKELRERALKAEAEYAAMTPEQRRKYMKTQWASTLKQARAKRLYSRRNKSKHWRGYGI